MKQKLVEFKNEIDTSTMIAESFNTLLSIMAGTTRQKVSKNTEDSCNQLDLT